MPTRAVLAPRCSVSSCMQARLRRSPPRSRRVPRSGSANQHGRFGDVSSSDIAQPGLGGLLQRHRLRSSFWIAAVEGLLVVVHVFPHWLVFVLAAAGLGAWIYTGRSSSSGLVRQASWILAASQLLAILVPLVLFIAKTIAYAVVVIIAIVALVVLFAERGKS